MSHRMTDSPRPNRDSRTGEAALQWARSGGSAARVADLARRRHRRRQRLRQIAAATVATLALVTGLWLTRAPARVDATLASSRPALVLSAPEQRTLPDGSVVELKPGATISVEFEPTARRVRLTAGEAHFVVAKNHDVPFIVRAGEIEVRAVGTEFAVELAPKHVDVLVTEGRVAIQRPAAALDSAPLTLLDAGQATAISLNNADVVRPVAVPADEQQVRLAWRVPRIELSSTPLAEVLACFNRHGRVRLELAEPALGGLQLSGVLRPDSPQTLLHVLRTDFGLRDERLADGTIVIRRR